MAQQKTTLTNAEISASNAALNRLAATITDLPAGRQDIVLGFRLVQNAKPLAELADAYGQAHRQALLANGAKVDGERFAVADGNLQFDTPAQEVAAGLALAELAAIETEVAYYPLSLKRLASSGVPLDFSTLVPLQWLIADDVTDQESEDW